MAFACGPAVDDGDGSMAGSQDSSSGGASMSAGSTGSASVSDSTGSSAGTGMTTGDPSSSDGEGGCGPSPCDLCGPPCIDLSECIDGEWTCDCFCDVRPCPATPEIDFAQMSKTEPIDCGTASSNDDDTTWQAVHDCVLGQSAAQGAFWASWHSDDRYAVAGAVGETYALAWFWSPGDILRYDCSAIAATDGCVVAPGQICLTCVDMGKEQTDCTGPK